MNELRNVLTETDWKLFKQQKDWIADQNCPESNGLLHWIDAVQDAIVADDILTEARVFAHKEFRVEIRTVFHTTLTGRDKDHIAEQLEDFTLKMLDDKGDIVCDGEWQDESIREINRS